MTILDRPTGGAATADPRIDWALISLIVLASIGLSLLAGKDLNWDLLNYHFYVAHSFVNDRFQQDFMAANVQSYLNPLPYMPFYLLERAGWPTALIGATLAGIHSASCVFVYLIMRRTLASNDRPSQLFAFAGALLAFASPAYLMEVGTSFADITSAIFAMMALWLLVRPAVEAPWWRSASFLAGICAGAAAGMKLTNLIFLPAFAAVAFYTYGPSLRQRLSAALSLTAGAFAGGLVTHGYWSWRLWREFGNPIYPMGNTVVQSPDYPIISHQHERFLPDNIVDVLTLPFRMVQLRSWVHVESIAPDLRFAALVLVAFVVIAMILAKRQRPVQELQPHVVAFNAVLLFFGVSTVLWILTSGNSRYGIVPNMLCGPVIVLLVGRIAGTRKAAMTVIGTILVLQVAHTLQGHPRWAAGDWTKTWLEADIPEVLRKEPYLYVSLGGASNSYLVPLLAQGSGFTNPIGQVSIDLNGPGGERLRRLFARYEGRIRMLALGKPGEAKPLEQWVARESLLLARLGYEADPTDCLSITTAGTTAEAGMAFASEDLKIRHMTTCLLRPKRFEKNEEYERVTLAFKNVVAWCPKLFKPAYFVLNQEPGGWFANFIDSDVILRVDGDQVYVTPTHANADLFLGSFTDWANGKTVGTCSAIPDKPREVFTF